MRVMLLVSQGRAREAALVLSVGVVLTSIAACGSTEPVSLRPNVVLIYVDDLGYGDVGAYGARSGLTPNVDALAAGGLVLTDAHSSAATCTPSRFALLTGGYAFRNNADILPGDAPLLIPTTTRTLADVMHDAGYATGLVGKWHLGLGDGDVDWNGSIEPGPLELGFDYAFMIPATGDRVPTVYVENHHVVGLDPADPIDVSYGEPIDDAPTGRSHPDLLKQPADDQHSDTIVNGVSRIGYMSGGMSARWTDEDMADVLADKAKSFISDNADQPFFLFFSFHDIHVPRVPNERFAGTTGMGPRGDAIAQMDWVTGELIEALRTHGLEEQTLVVFTSDNGPVLDDGYGDEAVGRLGTHRPSGNYRGDKYSTYEAGTRAPTIVSWPGRVEPDWHLRSRHSSPDHRLVAGPRRAGLVGRPARSSGRRWRDWSTWSSSRVMHPTVSTRWMPGLAGRRRVANPWSRSPTRCRFDAATGSTSRRRPMNPSPGSRRTRMSSQA